jgi:acetyl esterase/lipase
MKQFSDLAPELRPIIAAGRPWSPDDPITCPRWEPDFRVARTECEIPGPAGPRRAKLYRPAAKAQETLPVMLWCHGGGYVAGNIDDDDPLCEQFALDADCCVATVDYRLAPEFPYPAGLEDCYAALEWLVQQADALRVDPARLAVAGGSAGGGLAAALALLARERGGPALCFQMPLYPMLDDRNCTPSSYEITAQNFPNAWNRTNNLYGWNCYLKDLHAACADIPPTAAPTRAADLRGLPPAFFCVGTLDMFRDETLDYATRLAQADVPVELHLYPGCFHGFESVYTPTRIGKRCRAEYVAAMRRALHGEA